ncbi:MAG: helix-turn-helix domain-containing protein [Negativibacillus massiliensis]|uniref:helix-turn-helix domain-containing protein n=1 Tax=Negativibacillus massiliensis TaxID=1871035 RepID=UPI0039A09DE4
MKAYNIGLFIKKKREEQHIRQEDLCRGICDKSTLSRIERGKQEPSSGILGVLLQRLGINEDQLAVLLGPKDFEISDLQKEIVALNSQREYEKAAEKIRRLEQLVEPTDKITQQFILRCKALAYFPEDYPASRDLLLQALSLTLPDFDFDHISDYLLGIEEVKILNQIANSYSEAGDRRFAIHIYRQLFEDPRKRLFNIEAELTLLPLLAYNYSRLLGLERRYEEEIEIATLGQKTCIKYNKCQYLGGLLLNISCALRELGQDKESRSKLIDSFYAYHLMGDESSCNLIIQYAQNNGIELF